MKRLSRSVSAAALAAAFALGSASEVKALSVFDGANYSQNLLTAVRTQEMINNQIQSLQHEVLMLQNQARHLEPLDYSSLAAIESGLGRINRLMAEAEGIAFEIGRTEQAFAALYPKEYEAAVTGADLARDARGRWEHSMDALRQTLLVQAGVVRNVEADTAELARLLVESEAAVGSLQAQQASNQLVALSAKQQLQTQELMAAQYRAEALERARATAAQEQARARFDRFLGDRQAYRPN